MFKVKEAKLEATPAWWMCTILSLKLEGQIGHVLRASLLPRLDVPLGHSPDRVFPLHAVLADDFGPFRAQCVTHGLDNDAVVPTFSATDTDFRK